MTQTEDVNLALGIDAPTRDAARQSAGRYRAGYDAATASISIASLAKAFGWFIAFVTLLGGIAVAKEISGDLAGPFLFCIAIVGAVQIFVCYVFAIQMACAGHTLLASLDTAVNTASNAAAQMPDFAAPK